MTALTLIFSASAVEAKVPKNAVTATDVCVVYSVNSVYNGQAVMFPDTVSYRYVASGAFLWLPGQNMIKVETLSLTPITSADQCFSIV